MRVISGMWLVLAVATVSLIGVSDTYGECCESVPGVCSECCPGSCGCISDPDGSNCVCTGCGGGGIHPNEGASLNFSAKNVELGMALQLLGKRTDMKLVAPSLEGSTVNIDIKGIPFDELVGLLARQQHAVPVFWSETRTVELVPQNEIATRPFSVNAREGAHVTGQFHDLEVGSALRAIGAVAAADIAVAAGVRARVSVAFEDVPWREALQLVLDESGAHGRVIELPNGLIRVVGWH